MMKKKVTPKKRVAAKVRKKKRVEQDIDTFDWRKEPIIRIGKAIIGREEPSEVSKPAKKRKKR